MITSTMRVREWVRVKQAADILGVSLNTVRVMCDRGELQYFRSQDGPTGHRFVSMQSIREFTTGEKDHESERLTVLYARVSTSSQAQKQSLKNQCAELKEYARKSLGLETEDFLLLSEHGSGVDLDNRKEFSRLLELVFAGKVERVVCTHLERISRTGSKLLSNLFERFNCRIEVIHQKPEQTLEEELLAEVTACLYSYGAKSQGRRAAAKKKFQISEENLELLEKWQDEGYNARQVHKLASERGMKDEKSGTALKYAFISRLMAKRRKQKLAIAKAGSEGGFIDERLHQFFVKFLKHDSTGNAETSSGYVKEVFEKYAKEKGWAINKINPHWWANLLKENGLQTYRNKEKRTVEIKGWKMKNSRR